MRRARNSGMENLLEGEPHSRLRRRCWSLGDLGQSAGMTASLGVDERVVGNVLWVVSRYRYFLLKTLVV